MVSIRQGLIGLAIGVAGGVIAGIVLAPRRRSALEEDATSGPLSSTGRGRGLMPDERISERIRAELDRQATGNRIDVTTVDGVVYLRGREPDPVKADEAVAAAYAVPGVRDVIDEIRREA